MQHTFHFLCPRRTNALSEHFTRVLIPLKDPGEPDREREIESEIRRERWREKRDRKKTCKRCAPLSLEKERTGRCRGTSYLPVSANTLPASGEAERGAVFDKTAAKRGEEETSVTRDRARTGTYISPLSLTARISRGELWARICTHTRHTYVRARL